MEKKQIKCPQCGQATFYSLENQYRPFCSERCRLIDLGEWADGKYAIPVTQLTPDLEKAELSDEDLEDEAERSQF